MSEGKTLAQAVQERLARFYHLDDVPPVEAFAVRAGPGGREEVLVREVDDAVEIAVVLPDEAFGPANAPVPVDGMCQVVEGVSHFVYLVERIRTGLPATQLELELQAEVDKFVVLGLPAIEEEDRGRAMHARLYERVSFIHPKGTEAGERYRLANELAARLCARIGPHHPRTPTFARARAILRRFHRLGQSEKIRLASAA